MLNRRVYKILEFELLCSLISPEQIVSWADEQIIEFEEPEEILLDLCVAKSEDKQFKVFGILDSSNENEAFELVATELLKKYNSGAIDFFEATNKILLMHYHSSKLDADTTDFIIWLDDESCLITEGIKELESAKQKLHKFLSAIASKHNKGVHGIPALSRLHP